MALLCRFFFIVHRGDEMLHVLWSESIGKFDKGHLKVDACPLACRHDAAPKERGDLGDVARVDAGDIFAGHLFESDEGSHGDGHGIFSFVYDDGFWSHRVDGLRALGRWL